MSVADSIAIARAQLAGATLAGPTVAVVSAALASGPGFSQLVTDVRAGGGEIILSGDGGPTEILTLVRDHAIDHIVTCDPIGFADELPLTIRGLAATAALDGIGVERYLTHGAPLTTVVLDRTQARGPLLIDLRDRLTAMDLSARHQRQAALIADELLTNAIYDAPDGPDLSSHDHARVADRPLLGRERPRLRWGGDGRLLAIEVTDRFGSLDARTVRTYIAKLLDRSTVPRQGHGGAGLGLAMTFLATSQLVFHLDRGRVTQAIGIIDLRPRPDGGHPRVPSLHVFTATSATQEPHG